MAKQYKSDALAAAHETALGLTEAGVMAKRTMRVFDEMRGRVRYATIGNTDAMTLAQARKEARRLLVSFL